MRDTKVYSQKRRFGNKLNSNIGILGLIQFFFAIVIGMYFLNLMRSQQGNKIVIERESKKEMEKLKKMREISLTEPLSEKTRPEVR